MSGLTPDDEALVRQARVGLEPTDQDLERIERKMFVRLGLGVGAATSALSASTSASAGAAVGAAASAAAAVKLLAGLCVVGGLLGTSLLALRASPPPVHTNEPRASIVATSVPAPPSPPRSSDAPVLAPAPVVSTAPAPMRRTEHHAPVEAPSAAPAPLPSPNSPPSPTSLAGSSTVAREAQLLRDADSARRAGDGARALSLLNEHASLFPKGMLVEERDAERIVVLCALGQTSAAHDAATTFLRDHARSPLVARVRASCVGPSLFVTDGAPSSH